MFADYLATLCTFQRHVWFYFVAISLIGFTVDGGIYSVVFNLFLLRLDYDPAFIIQVNATGLLAFVLCSLPAGALGSHLGNRQAMIVGLSIMMVGSLLLTFSEWIPTAWREPWLFGTYILFHGSIALFFVNGPIPHGHRRRGTTEPFMLPLALIPTWWAAGIGYMGVMAGSSIRYTAFIVYGMGMIKPEQRSFMSGIAEMTAGLSFADMALIGSI